MLLFESFKNIESICKKYGIRNYTINVDGSVDVDGRVNLYNKGLTKLPLKFGVVSDSFDCHSNKLTSLEGCPKEVGGYFSCSGNQLTSLEGGPKEVGGSFFCQNNKLTSLKGAPPKIGGQFYCGNNPLPRLIYDNMKYIDKIVEYQDDYSIWRPEGIEPFRWSQMMEEILEE